MTYTLVTEAKVGFVVGFDPFTFAFPFPLDDEIVEVVMLSVDCCCCCFDGGEGGLLLLLLLLLLTLFGPVDFPFCCCSKF